MISLVEEIATLFTNSDIVYAVVDKGYETVFFYDYCEAVDGYLKNITVMGSCITISYNYKEIADVEIADVKREIANIKGGV